jgi:2'-5' RNA ligase
VRRLCERFDLTPPESSSASMPWRRWWCSRPDAALLIPVPEAEHALGSCPAWSAGLPAHVTVLFPFRPAAGLGRATERALRELVAGVASFGVRYGQVERFPGVAYLAPQPAEPFRALTDAIVARWPESPAYEGAYDEVIPHLTLVEGPEPAGLVERVEQLLPVAAEAKEVWLVQPRFGRRWAIRGRFALGEVPLS